MGKTHGIVQTVKGKAQRVQGEIQQQTGHGVKGGIYKLKGKAKETIGKIQIEGSKSKKDDFRE